MLQFFSALLSKASFLAIIASGALLCGKMFGLSGTQEISWTIIVSTATAAVVAYAISAALAIRFVRRAKNSLTKDLKEVQARIFQDGVAFDSVFDSVFDSAFDTPFFRKRKGKTSKWG